MDLADLLAGVPRLRPDVRASPSGHPDPRGHPAVRDTPPQRRGSPGSLPSVPHSHISCPPGTSQWPRAGAPGALSPSYDGGLHGLVSTCPAMVGWAGRPVLPHGGVVAGEAPCGQEGLEEAPAGPGAVHCVQSPWQDCNGPLPRGSASSRAPHAHPVPHRARWKTTWTRPSTCFAATPWAQPATCTGCCLALGRWPLASQAPCRWVVGTLAW